MIAVPAIDLRGGEAVQLVGGEPGSERIRIPDPLSLARRWAAAGFTELHIVDLDAALGQGDSRAAAELVMREGGLPCQAGGGIRDDEAIETMLGAGATRVIVGTRAIEDPAWLRAAAVRWSDRLVVAADARDGRIVTRGWTHDTSRRVDDFVARLDALPLAAVLVTDVGREGREQGVDIDLFERLAARTRLPLQAAGGVTTHDDLRGLREAGVTRAVLGMALYTGKLNPETTAREFGS
jgi:phosphoribosylformimino-5-aminoimidazole carboxamide ribotide isomerase